MTRRDERSVPATTGRIERSVRGSVRRDTRGVSEVLGVVFAFALVMSVLATVQLTAVPVWVNAAEVKHSDSLQAQVVDLDEAVLRAGFSGVAGQERLDLSATYPSRYAFVTPPPVAGSVATSGAAPVTISNAEATGAAGVYWDGSDRTFDARSLTAAGTYHQFHAGATHTIEPGAIHTQSGEGELVVHQALVSGNRLTLVAVDGDLARSSTGSEVVSVTPLSSGASAVQVESADGSPISVRVPTALSADAWTDALAEEPYATLADYDDAGDVAYATVDLDPTQTYTLRLAKVGVGTGWTAEGPAYVVVADGDGEAVPEGATHRVTVEVRDRFNNPVAGATVRADDSASQGAVSAASDPGSQTAETDDDGRVTFVYDAPDDVSAPTPDTFGLSVDGVAGAAGTASISVEVRDSTDEAGFGFLELLAILGLGGVTRGRSSARSRSSARGSAARGTTTLLGLVFTFAMVVSLVVLLQVSAVPGWNGSVEFDHDTQVDTQLTDLDEAIWTVAGGGGGSGGAYAAVDASPDYPSRPMLVNPAGGAGSMETTLPLTVTVSNLAATGPDGKYWDGTPHTYETQALVFEASYESLDDDPAIVHEGAVFYTEHDNGAQLLNRQLLVDGNRVTLVLLAGDVDEQTTGLTGVEVVPLSVGQSVSATESDDPITIEFPTYLSEEAWHEALADQPNVQSVSYAPSGDHGYVTIVLKPGVEYDFSVAKVGLNPDSSGEPPAYVVVTSGDDPSVPEGGSQRVVVEVRDEYNNPVPGVDVALDDDDLAGDVRAPNGLTTDDDGRVVLTYTAPEDVDGDTDTAFDVSVPGITGPNGEETISVTVVDSDGSGEETPLVDFEIEDGEVVPGGAYSADVVLIDTAIRYGGDGARVPVSVEVLVHGAAAGTGWPANVNDGENPRYYNLTGGEAGSAISVRAEANGLSVRSTDGSRQVEVLRDGDPVPSVSGFGDQDDVADLVVDYAGDDGTITLADNQAIFLFELGSTDERSSAFDLQDAVVLVTLYESGDDGADPDAEGDASTEATPPSVSPPSTDVSVTVPDVCTLGDDPGFAFVDADGDGRYDAAAGDERIDGRDADDLRNGAFSASSGTLVVPESVGPITADKIDFEAEGIVLDVDVTATGGGVKLTAGDRGLCVSGTAVESTKDGKRVELKADHGLSITGATVSALGDVSVSADAISLDGATVRSTKDGKHVELTARDGLSARNARVVAPGEVALEAGSMVLDGATVESTKDGKKLKFDADDGIRAIDATFRAEGPIEFNSDGPVDLRNAAVENPKDSADVVVDARGGVDLRGASITNVGSITVDAVGTLAFDGAALTSDKEQNIELTAGDDLSGDGATLSTRGHVELDAGGHVAVVDASVVTQKDNKHVHVTAGLDADLRGTELAAGGASPSPGADVVVTVGDGQTVFVSGTTVSDRDDTLTVSPESATVVTS